MTDSALEDLSLFGVYDLLALVRNKQELDPSDLVKLAQCELVKLSIDGNVEFTEEGKELLAQFDAWSEHVYRELYAATMVRY